MNHIRHVAEEGLSSGSVDPARTLTYAREIASRPKRVFCRAIESVTGRHQLARRARNYHLDICAERSFWEVCFDRLEASVRWEGAGLEGIPREGPLICVANHPFGLVDGLALGLTLSRRRKDFKILTNSVLCRVPEITDFLLPIVFDQSREALDINLKTRKTALQTLADAGAIAVFPGGTVSTSARPFGRAIDPEWKTFTAKMILKSEAVVVPLYFNGQNSRLFQIASHMSQTLRLSLMINEMKKCIGKELVVTIGAPISPQVIAQHRNAPADLMEALRLSTYQLSGSPITWREYGWPHKSLKTKVYE